MWQRLWRAIKGVFKEDDFFGEMQVRHLRRLIFLLRKMM
jgi:hypothetical protein